MQRPARYRLLSLLFAVPLISCGGGSDDGGDVTPPPASTPTPAPAPAPTPPPAPPPAPTPPPPAPTPAPAPAPSPATPPALLPPVRLLENGPDIGTRRWPDGPGIGAAATNARVDDIPCGLGRIGYHVHPHLRILLDGQPLKIPAEIGLGTPPRAGVLGCAYAIHTHDGTGVLHAEWETPRRLTLGQFFRIWGQPLSRTQVADVSGVPIVFWIIDGNRITEWTGNPADIELTSNRNIVIQAGARPDSLQVYTFD